MLKAAAMQQVKRNSFPIIVQATSDLVNDHSEETVKIKRGLVYDWQTFEN
jgi:phosphohistidine swiveling domain-containing protein